jgi:hypothetical protein
MGTLLVGVSSRDIRRQHPRGSKKAEESDDEIVVVERRGRKVKGERRPECGEGGEDQESVERTSTKHRLSREETEGSDEKPVVGDVAANRFVRQDAKEHDGHQRQCDARGNINSPPTGRLGDKPRHGA